MTKTIKMSLVAAIAVTGFSSAASASSLEEVIKGIDVSGKFEVEYDRTTTDNGTESTTNESDLDIDMTFKAPISDNVTAVFAIQADQGDDLVDDGSTSASDDAITATKHYMSINTEMATVNVGKQSIGTPFFDDERGNGAVVLVPAGSVTLAAASFSNVNGVTAIEDESISAAAVIGSASGVDFSLWYAQISNVATAYTVNAAGTFGKVTVDARYSSADYGDLNSAYDAEKLAKISATYDAGAANVTLAYAMTNEDMGTTGAGVDLESSDTDAATNFGGELYAIDDLSDASVVLLGADTTVGELGLNAYYFTGEYGDADTDFDELYVGAEYPLAKMTKVTGFYAMGSIGDTDDTSMSVAIEHKF